MSVADDKLSATARRVSGSGPGLLASLRAQHPALATVLIRGAEVAAWVAFYIVVRALTG